MALPFRSRTFLLGTLFLLLLASASAQTPTISQINPDPVSPGTVASLTGANFAATSSFPSTVGGAYPTTWAGVTISVGGKAAAFLSISPTLMTFQVPVELAAGATTLVVERVVNGQTFRSAPFNLTLLTHSPVFNNQMSGIVNATFVDSGATVTRTLPAKAGDTISAGARGLGPTNPVVATGVVTTAFAPTTSTARVTLGGRDCEVLSTGLSPGALGIYAVRFRVPANPPGGDQVLLMEIGGKTSPSTILPVAATSIPATPMVLSQFVFGDGFYTAIYLHNSTSSSVPVTVAFFGNNGQPMNVPALGGTTTTANIPAGGVGLLEAPNNGALQQGWARVDLPSGVTGYGVFRQSVPGRADQEAVVPFASYTSSGSTLIFDDVGLTTAFAAANPANTSVTVTLTAKSNVGTPLGTATLNLLASGKSAGTLRSLIPAVAGQRGTVQFTVTSGAVSVLGLRFGAEAFTSIPATER